MLGYGGSFSSVSPQPYYADFDVKYGNQQWFLQDDSPAPDNTLTYTFRGYVRCMEHNYFTNFNNIRVIDFQTAGSSPLTKVPKGWFIGLTNLISLKLKTFKIIPQESFRDLINLKTLDLADNGLDMNTIHPRTFLGLTALESLILTGNSPTYSQEQKAIIQKYCQCNVVFTP
jgi:hypothetical protein